MDKDYYFEYYQSERSHWWFLARIKILEAQIRRVFPASRKLKILNIGVATGASTEMLLKFGTVTSIEYNQECIDFMKDKLPFEVEYGSILDLQFADNEFDLVCAFDVVEHVEDDGLAVKEMFRVCKPNGLVIVSVPAFASLWGPHDVINHHFRRYIKPQLLELGSKYGQVFYASYFNTFLFPPIYLVRRILNFLPKTKEQKDPRSDLGLVNSKIINSISFHIFHAENYFLKRGMVFPFGVSALALWYKK